MKKPDIKALKRKLLQLQKAERCLCTARNQAIAAYDANYERMMDTRRAIRQAEVWPDWRCDTCGGRRKKGEECDCWAAAP